MIIKRKRLENLILIQKFKNLNLKGEISKFKEQELIFLKSIERNSKIEKSLLLTELSMSVANSNNTKVIGMNIIDKSRWKDQAHLLRKNCMTLNAKVTRDMKDLQIKNRIKCHKLNVGFNLENNWKNEIRKQFTELNLAKEILYSESLTEIRYAKKKKNEVRYYAKY